MDSTRSFENTEHNIHLIPNEGNALTRLDCQA